MLFSCLLNAFLVEIGVNTPASNVTGCCPGRKTLASIIDEEAVNSLSIIRESMKGCEIFFSCDGANEGMHHALKATSWRYVDRAMNVLLDTDSAVGTNQSAAEAIDISLKKLDNVKINAPNMVTSVMCADTRGGGARVGLANEMMKVGRTCAMDIFITTTCSHHGFNSMMAFPREKFFGDSGIQNRNLLQPLCTWHAIQKSCEMSEFR